MPRTRPIRLGDDKASGTRPGNQDRAREVGHGQ